MEKCFNVNADCKPALHYMVDIRSKLEQIKSMVDAGQYFTVNRARQYGKTTTLRALGEFLKNDYLVVSLDFQIMSTSKFRNEHTFSIAFAKMFMDSVKYNADPCISDIHITLKEALKKHNENLELFELFQYLNKICRLSPRPVVLIIDEIDSAANKYEFFQKRNLADAGRLRTGSSNRDGSYKNGRVAI